LILAVHNYNDTYKSMPFYWASQVTSGSHRTTTGAAGSWYVQILPYLEQQPAWNLVIDTGGNFGTSTSWDTAPDSTCRQASCTGGQVCVRTVTNPTGNTSQHVGHSFQSATSTCVEWRDDGPRVCTSASGNCGSGQQTSYRGPDAIGPGNLAALHCPSDPRTGETQFAFRFGRMYALTNYQANYNAFRDPSVSDFANSARRHNTMTRISVSDGLSNTIFFGEGHRLCDVSGSRGIRVAVWSDQQRHNFGVDWNGIANTFMFQSKPRAPQCNNWRVQSMHDSNLQVAMGDGSVRGISDTIDRAETSSPNDTSLGAQITMGANLGSWDRLLLPMDGGTPVIN
jgi:hypothetical protein